MDTHHEKSKGLKRLYLRGETTIFASRFDPRFPYALFVPHRFDSMPADEVTLLVSVHGTGRMQSLYRDLFAEFTEYHNCIVIAPLFPVGVRGDGNLHGYKYIEEGDIRYDQVILAIVDEVAETFRVSGEKVLMFGFSGGAHFTHRFTILHPERIKAASIGAPGSVTLLDRTRPWWVGIGDVEQRFGVTVDMTAFESLPIHMAVGSADNETWEITHNPGDPYYMRGANDAGRTRIDRLNTLADTFRSAGACVRFDTVVGKMHDVVPVARHSRAFFHDVLAGNFPSPGP